MNGFENKLTDSLRWGIQLVVKYRYKLVFVSETDIPFTPLKHLLYIFFQCIDIITCTMFYQQITGIIGQL